MFDVESRALQSGGASDRAIYQMAARAIRARPVGGGALIDVGCGEGALWAFLRDRFRSYIGVDIVRFNSFPGEGQFHKANLDAEAIPLPADCADVVVALETIEHLENPRGFVRDLVRLLKADGLLVVTMPNQLSLMSKLSLVLNNEFVFFQESPGLYPAHITALLETDLLKIGRECGLVQLDIVYSNCGRIPLTSWHWPRWLGGRPFSDNLGLVARKPKP
jgi:SAM-dependent methyltransferase